jgi:serine/threonine protein kinase/tetratricopeptide (TPR) repeat protein
MIPEIGRRFGPYEILGRLGGGGMGLVFRAWDERLHREVAVKLLVDDYKMPGMRERFLQEARAASALNHPNICTVFDIGEQDHNPYLVMELLEGETVKDRIAHGALTAEEIVRYAMEIANALSVAHAKGVVHRDIKPANIFLVKMPTGKSQAKVLDFGLAKIGLEERGGWQSRTLDLTVAGSTVGTLAYMSPEQARGESLDLRSDLFSLGIVLYEMATRQVPFRGTTSALMFVQLFSHNPEPVRNWNESIPRELEKIIFKLLEKDRKKRFRTAKELNDALMKVSGKLSRGGWLNKGAAPAVPLVRASDPIARHKTPKRRAERSDEDSRPEVRTQPGGSMSSSDNMMIPPRRVPDGGGGSSVSWTPLHSSKASATAVDSGAIPAKMPLVTMAPVRDASISVLARSAHDFQNVDRHLQQGAVLEPAAPDSKWLEDEPGEVEKRSGARASFDQAELQELLAASSTVGARTRIRIVIAAALIIVGVAVVAMARSGLFRPLVLGGDDRLLLTVIQNQTPDKALDGTVMQGIEIALGQSKSLNVLGGRAYHAGLQQIESENGNAGPVSEQRIAQKLEAKAYLYGVIRGSEPPYTISVEILKSDSNDKVATLEVTAPRREDIPAAIGRLAQAIRLEVSGDGETAVGNSILLSDDATSNVDALHAYAIAESSLQRGRTHNALLAYQQAVSLDPKFVQAEIQLSWLYQSEKAEVASSESASIAYNSASRSSDRVKLLAEFCYEMNATGSYGRANEIIRKYVARYPRDAAGMRGMARVLRLQGLLPEALLAAEQGYGDHPFDAETYAEAELAMIGMDRFDNALQLEAQARRNGIQMATNTLTTAYLAGREDIVAAQASAMQASIAENSTPSSSKSYAEQYNYAVYLDNTGKMNAALDLWRSAAARAGDGMPELVSTQSSMLAQGALDRALAENCKVALEMVGEIKNLLKGPVASFNAGMAAALCGDQPYAEKTVSALQQSFPQNTAVAEYFVPELRAAAELGINEPGKALQSLNSLSQYDRISLTPYLRGMTNAALGLMPDAMQDFGLVLAHRGLAMTLNGNAYPMAQLGMARASARNKTDSVIAYRRFLALWGDADRSQPMMVEAISRSK